MGRSLPRLLLIAPILLGCGAAKPHADASRARDDERGLGAYFAKPVAPVGEPLATTLAQAEAASPPVEATLQDSPRGQRVIARAAGVELTVPPPQAGAAFVGPSLAKVHRCRNEWDTEFSLVADASLPFSRLAAHVGSEPFCGGGSYYDLHVRLYTLKASVDEARVAIAKGGGAEVLALDKSDNAGRPDLEDPNQSTDGSPANVPSWTRVHLTYTRFYYDYGGRAHVDVYLRRMGDWTIAVMFMYVGRVEYVADGTPVNPIADILASVKPAGA